MTELKIQSLAASIRGNQYLFIVGKRLLRFSPFLKAHGSIQLRRSETPFSQEFTEHRLSRNEFRENQYFEFGITLLLH